MLDLVRLSTIAFQPGELKKLYARAAAILPDFPTNSCSITAALLLQEVGLTTLQLKLPFITRAQFLLETLKKSGDWNTFPVSTGCFPGDVVFSKDMNKNKMTDHVFIVLAPLDGDKALVVDNRLGALNNFHPYVRNLGPGTYTEAETILRYKKGWWATNTKARSAMVST